MKEIQRLHCRCTGRRHTSICAMTRIGTGPWTGTMIWGHMRCCSLIYGQPRIITYVSYANRLLLYFYLCNSFAEGIAYAQKGQLDDAIKAYSQSIQIDSKCIEGYIARGCT